MKKQKQFEKWANEILEKAQKVLLLEHFTLGKISYNKEKPEVSDCKFHYPYQTIKVRYSKYIYEDWEKGDKTSAIEVLVHEMCHPLTDGLYAKASSRYCTRDEVEDEREKLTDHIANIIIKKFPSL